jgi:hypothetical protein
MLALEPPLLLPPKEEPPLDEPPLPKLEPPLLPEPDPVDPDPTPKPPFPGMQNEGEADRQAMQPALLVTSVAVPSHVSQRVTRSFPNSGEADVRVTHSGQSCILSLCLSHRSWHLACLLSGC